VVKAVAALTMWSDEMRRAACNPSGRRRAAARASSATTGQAATLRGNFDARGHFAIAMARAVDDMEKMIDLDEAFVR
jgi:hypothetical protein